MAVAKRSVRVWVVVGIVVAVLAAGGVAWLLRPKHGDVLVIGDSLTVLAEATGLEHDGWDIDARPGRRTPEAIAVAQRRHASDYPVVIVAMGSNDDPQSVASYRRTVDDMMSVLGTGPRVIWVNVDTGAKGLNDAATVNEALAKEAKSQPNLEIGDWDSYVRSIPDFDEKRAPDQIHYRRTGSRLRARWTLLVGAEALAQVEAGEDR